MEPTAKRKTAECKFGVSPILPLIALLCVMGGTGMAADTRLLTFSGAVIAALENNHELRSQRNSYSAKQADVGIARSMLLPKISFEERYLRTANPAYAFMTKLNQGRIESTDFVPDSMNRPDAVSDFQSAVSFEQPLFMRKAYIGLDMSKIEAAVSEENLKRKQEEVAFRVVQNCLLADTAARYVDIVEKGLEDAREHQRLAETRFGAGLGLYSDTLRAATAVAEAEQKRVSAGKNLRVARLALGLLIGSADAVEVTGEIPALPLRKIEELRAQSLTRKDVQSLELRAANARNSVKLAEANYFPSVGMGGAYQLNDHNRPFGSEGDSWQVTAALRWEIFDGTKRKHERTKARFEVSEAEEYLAGMREMVSFQVEEAWLSLEEAKQNSELARKALATAEEGRRLVKVRYEGSLSPIVDMLDAQVSFDHARANLVARENEYKLAIANLCFASGTILDDLKLKEPGGGTE